MICYLGWWPGLLVFSNQKGAATAEFMLLFPAVVLALSGVLGVFQIGVTQLQLSRDAFTQARLLSMGMDPRSIPGASTQKLDRGNFVCALTTKKLWFDLEAEACLLKHGL